MKKVKYSFISLLLVALCATMNAQFYTETYHRTYGWSYKDGSLNISEANWAKGGGTAGETRVRIASVSVLQRGVEKYSHSTQDSDFGIGNGNAFGVFVKDYVDLSSEMADVEIIAGQEFVVNVIGGGDIIKWSNATAFIDWDGNGAFDDHELKKYNLYDMSTVQKVEFAAGDDAQNLDAKWTFLAPNVTEERLVRIRIRYDEGINETVYVKKNAIRCWAEASATTNAIPECNLVQVSETQFQNFCPMLLNRFTPSGQFVRGSTVDLTVKIVPDPYAVAMQEKETVTGAGNIGSTCQSTQGTAITDAAGFAAFLSATSGDYYLANDITLNSLPVSQAVFTGTFDGNGHTITFASNATADFHNTSKDKCFYPYGLNDKAIGENLLGVNVVTPSFDMTDYPARAIAGGFCGLLEGGTIKNVKIVYAANATYKNNATEAPIFGLVAGINRGRIENVSVDVQTGKTITLQNSQSPTASAFGGITGLLHWGVVKHCAVNLDGTLKHEGSAAMQETLTSAFIGRLQVGVVSNVKFSGSGTMYANSAVVANVRNCMGGIAAMTHNPQGEFCTDQSYDKQLKSWGFDNGSTSCDVNNVILSYSGAMNMASAADNNSYAYHCRGLLFGEAHDTIVVPNLITQYATAPTIEKEAPADASLTDIPLISRTKGLYNALIPNGEYGVTGQNKDPRLMGKLFLYKSGAFTDYKDSKDNLFTNVNVADTELDWAYEFDPNSCTYYSTPYAVATYTGTNANIQGIEAASANVSDLGSAVVKVDPQPETVAAPSWTWSETASPATPNTDSPVCGGGGETIAPLLTYCTPGNQGNSGEAGQRSITSFTINGTTIAVNETSANNSPAYRGYKNSEANAIEVTPGQTFTISSNHQSNWIHINAFVDWNHDGVFERIGRSPNANAGGAASFTVTVPNDAPIAYTPLRLMLAWLDVNDACAFSSPDNPCLAVDIVLKVKGVDTNTRPATLSCTISGNSQKTDRQLRSLSFTGSQGASLSSGTIQNTKNRPAMYYDLRDTKSLEVQAGEVISTTVDFDGSWMMGYIYVDWNNDGDFSDSGEYMASPYNVRNNNYYTSDYGKPKDFTIPTTVTPGATYTMRYTLDWNSRDGNDAVDEGVDYPCGRTATTASGNFTANNGGCMVDFELKIAGTLPTPPAADGDGCAYVANFGNVYVGDVATYDISLGAGPAVDIVADVADEYELDYDDATGILTVTYTVPTTPGAVSVDSIGAITKGSDEFRIAVSATVKAAPTVTFRMSESGGGALSLDMGKSTFIEPRTLAPYKGNLLTAVPVGPTHIVGWFVSTDGGTTFNAVGHANPDYTYTGTDDAIVEVRFDFDDFEGDFGLAKFTDSTNPPFYITSVKATGGIVNIVGANGTDAVPMFTDDVVGGEVRFMYKEDARLQTLLPRLDTLSHEVTVTLTNGTTIPADARLLCFIDYNMNNYFDFTSSPNGLASALTENNELVYVGTPNGNADQTFTFTISNTDVTKFGKTRMRFMVATYVDMYGLGPVNQYGNYQPRIDTDGDGFADQELPLNDNNGKLYDPNNQCRYENYVNVADVTFEVVAYVRYNDKYTIKNGESVRMNNLYVEAQEDANGFQAGQIVFDKNAPYGSLIVEGNIILRRRIYPDKWHDVAFPIEMQGVGGQDGICAVGANGALAKLPATGKHLVYEFDPAGRNQTGGYGAGTKASADTTFQQNKFYEFAADVPDGFTANDAGADIDGVNSYWIQFHSVKEGFTITPSAAITATLSYTRDEDAAEYWNRNVFTIYNPFLSNINVNEITASLGWEHITWWNAIQGRYTGVSAAETRDMPPYFGYWIQFTEGIGSGTPVEIVLGDANRADYPYADDRIVNFGIKSASAANTSTFDTPDAYTLGIDHVSKAINKNATSTTIVTLTDAGSIDDFRAGYDMPVSLSNVSSSIIPEIWSKAGVSRMMFNDVMRDDEVVVPVGIRIKEAGEYVVRLTHTNHTASLVQLYDKQTGAKVDLQRNGELFTYSFLAEQGDAERFDLIIIAPNAMTDLDAIESDEELSGATIYNVGNTLRLVNLPLGYTVAVCDVVGRELMQTKVVDADMQLQLPNNQGVYLVNVRNENGSSVQVVKLTR